jgi:Ca2+-binding RTX toxin-like protein
MMKITIHDAAGDFREDTYPVDELDTAEVSERRMVLEGDITSGVYEGETYSIIYRGRFHIATETYYYISSVRLLVGEDEFIRLDYDGQVTNNKGFDRQLEAGIHYIGNRFDNYLLGGEGKDRIDGGTGSDTMFGGAGDDVYVIDRKSDVVREEASQGKDTVRTTVSYALPDHVENVKLLGPSAKNASGNASDNSINGTKFANMLSGGAGHDSVKGLAGQDKLSGGEGKDTLDGGDGKDILDGGTGGDRLIGGRGDDVYFIDSEGDHIRENEGDEYGYDTVVTSVSVEMFFLVDGDGVTSSEGIEEIILAGDKNLGVEGSGVSERIVGNSGNNLVTGDDGEDTLIGGIGEDRVEGGDGSDTLRGGEGDDTLTGGHNGGGDMLIGGAGSDVLEGGLQSDYLSGGKGADVFVFGPLGNSWRARAHDVIADFELGVDTIELTQIYDDHDWSGNPRFEFIGSDVFSGEILQLRYNNSHLSGDVDGDGKADFVIEITNGALLTEADLLI